MDRIISGHQVPDISVVEVEINALCNRSCSYCPVSVLPIPQPPRYIDEEVFDKLLKELSDIEFSGRFSYHFYNEPLLHKDLEGLVKKSVKKLPNAFQVLYTNGDLLTEKRYNQLIDAGIDLIKVSSHSLEIIPERPAQIVLYPEDLVLTNRGGLLVNLPGSTSVMHETACFAPSEMFIVTITGDVLLCYEDAERNNVMGNIMEQSIKEIWYSDKFIRLRELLARGSRLDGASICKKCTNTDHNLPGNSFTP